MANNINYTEIQPGERLDNLTNRVYGKPDNYNLLVLNNPKLDLFDPRPGMLVVVVNA